MRFITVEFLNDRFYVYRTRIPQYMICRNTKNRNFLKNIFFVFLTKEKQELVIQLVVIHLHIYDNHNSLLELFHLNLNLAIKLNKDT